MRKILIVEDSVDIQTQLVWGMPESCEILQALNREEAMKLFHKHNPQVVTLDLGLPPEQDNAKEGLTCLREMINEFPDTKVIVVTGNNDRENALKAIQMGAYDYYLKPIDINELQVIIQRAFHLSEIESENRKLHSMINKDLGFAGMIGESTGMKKIFETIQKVATTDATVLITGESGTGKELVARAIHDKSARNQGLFVPINCGAIPENLLESELFGHEKGAFTGAYTQQTGKFELADKGTLFLDEIGEMTIRLQSKLLRFLQEKKTQRVGGRNDIIIDTRVIVATNINLETAIKEGNFREDLFYRVSVISIDILPLREREFDIILLANTFLERYKAIYRKKIRGFSHAAMDAIERYAWPGNVRELENKLQKALITTDSLMIEPRDLGLDEYFENRNVSDTGRNRYSGISLKEARKRLEMDLVENVMHRHKGNIKRASEELGVSRPTLYDLIEKYKLSFKDNSQ